MPSLYTHGGYTNGRPLRRARQVSQSVVVTGAARSGGADLNRCSEAHAPRAEGEDGCDARAEAFEGGSIEPLKQLVLLDLFDSAPLVAAGERRAELATWLGVRR